MALQITVDQLRGDLIDRFSAGMTDHGFNYLLKIARYLPTHTIGMPTQKQS